jgi:hypothetical protein
MVGILGDTGFDPHRLELEITETALVDNLEMAQRVRDAPHLRLGQLRQNKAAGRFSGHVRPDAENAAILELRRAKLINAAAA